MFEQGLLRSLRDLAIGKFRQISNGILNRSRQIDRIANRRDRAKSTSTVAVSTTVAALALQRQQCRTRHQPQQRHRSPANR
ncbi:hypothetical protein [Chromatium okenii]|uniref:hypothetical protein n=1 Tax=Chromatium okenii TaxID=61644 RepID=UPI0011B03E63|nr:hypothetical protein [Chromatium okenii]